MRRLVQSLFLAVWCASSAAAQFPAGVATAYPDAPPRASLIAVSTPDASGYVTVTGAVGAVTSGTRVHLVTLDTGHLASSEAAADGSFSARLFAPPGASVMIKIDPERSRLVSDNAVSLAPMAGTILRVAEPPAVTSPAASFGAAGITRTYGGGAGILPSWTWQGTISTQSVLPGGTVSVDGTLRIVSPVVQTATAMRVTVHFEWERLTGPDGIGTMGQNHFASATMTPAGLPIERSPGTGNYTSSPTQVSLVTTGPQEAQAHVVVSSQVSSVALAGYYRPFLTFEFSGVPQESPPTSTVVGVDFGKRLPNIYGGVSMYLPIVRVGTPAAPHLFWTLLTDTLSNGTRGVRAVEDRDRFGLAPHVLTQSETFIVPRRDLRTGSPLRYRLEPFAPTISLSDRGGSPNAPLVPFVFPSGSLTVRVQKPDGTATTLGPAPFVQSRLRGPVRETGETFDSGGGHIMDVFQLSTMDPRFEVEFSQDGRHVISVEGTIRDIWGNTWSGGGTYEVYVAQALSLDTAVLPGTPFEVGDAFHPGVIITPGVTADVEVRFRLAPNSDATRMIERRVQGTSNRFGYFSGSDRGVLLEQPGEYRVDVTASFRDANGDLWMGARTWTGVVARPDSELIAHGRRGIDGQPTRPQWYFATYAALSAGEDPHINFPYHSGDVLWARDVDAALPAISMQDTSGLIDRLHRWGPSQTATGETELISSAPGWRDPHLDPSRVDVWSYGYMSVQRPLVRVRELVGEQYLIPQSYWRFDEMYAGQIGVGGEGDLPNDFKFQYSAVVLRGAAVGEPRYAIYGSLFVLVPDNDPLGSRVFPPFSSSTTGGRLFALRNRDINGFIHLTAIRPGSVLETGDTFSIAGALAPTLQGLVATTITLPSGRVLNQSGRANRVGYFYIPGNDFVADEPGIYTVDVRVTFDGSTSAGALSAPFPTGDVLGSTGGRFHVYVVPRGSGALTTSLPTTTRVTASSVLDLSAGAASGLIVANGHWTATMPGFLLSTGGAPASGNSVSYRYDPVSLSRDFPNLDAVPADAVSVSLFATLNDAAGRTTYAARSFALHGPDLIVPPARSAETTYSLSGMSGLTRTTNTESRVITSGYASIQPASGEAAPAGIAIITLRQNGRPVSEVSVPGAPTIVAGRLYAEVTANVNTGFALANPGAQDALVTFYLTDSIGNNTANGSTTVPARSQIARFLSEAPFNVATGFRGTFTFTSTRPLGAIALRGLTNERGQFLMTTLPVVELGSAGNETTIVPHFADGGGWATLTLLVNPTDSALNGAIQFLNPQGSVTSSETYTVAARSAHRFQTPGTDQSVAVGSMRVIPAAGTSTPSVLSIFSSRVGGVVVSESGVRAEPASTASRMYVELGTAGQSGAIQSGIAMANPSSSEITVNLELTPLSGSPQRWAGALTIPANGQVARFVDQFPGFETIPSPIQAILRVTTSTPSGVTVTGLRGRSIDGEFLMAATPAIDENAAPQQSAIVFPHFADGAGYTTQFVVLPRASSASGTLQLLSATGLSLDLGLR